MGCAGDGQLLACVVAKLNRDGVANLHAKIVQRVPLQHDFIFLRGPLTIH
jgi:hypothetical protein